MWGVGECVVKAGPASLAATASITKLPKPDPKSPSWAQFFLKFVVSHPQVTNVIPATSKVDHMIDNMGAGYGRLPDAKMRERMVRYLEAL
jgi:diketogulonate reductase-like aldo/keto reductase